MQEQKQKQRLQTCHEKTQDKWQGKKKARGKAEARQRQGRGMLGSESNDLSK